MFIRIEFERLVRLVGANRTKNPQEQLIFPSGLDFDLDLITTRDLPYGATDVCARAKNVSRQKVTQSG